MNREPPGPSAVHAGSSRATPSDLPLPRRSSRRATRFASLLAAAELATVGIAGPVAAHSVGDTKKTEWVADQRCLTGKSTVWHSGGNVLQAQAITHFSKYLCGHFNSYQGLPKDQLGVDFDFWRDNGKSGPKLCHDGNLRKNTTTAHQMSDSTAVTKTSCGNPGGYVWDYWASAAHKRLINKPATLHTSTSHHPW